MWKIQGLVNLPPPVKRLTADCLVFRQAEKKWLPSFVEVSMKTNQMLQLSFKVRMKRKKHLPSSYVFLNLNYFASLSPKNEDCSIMGTSLFIG